MRTCRTACLLLASLCSSARAETPLSAPPPLLMEQMPSPDAIAEAESQPYEALPLMHQSHPAQVDVEPVVLASQTEDPDDAQEAPPVTNVSENNREFIRALASVYAHHPQINAEREALKATDEGVAQAVSGFRPTATVNYNTGRQRTNINHEGWDTQHARETVLDIQQPLFNGGGTVASYSSAKKRVLAGRAQLGAVEQQVLFNAISAYTEVVARQQILEANRRNLGVLSDQQRGTGERFRVGELTRTDVAQSEARLALAEAGVRQAEGDLESARATFRRIIGYEPPSGLQFPPLLASLPGNLGEATRLAETTEPTLEAARQLEKAARSDVNIRQSVLLPAVSLEGLRSRERDNFPGQRRFYTNAVLLNVTIPLYQSGAEWSQVREANNLAQQARFTTIDTREGVIENATRAWNDYLTSKAVITSNERAVGAAEHAVTGIRKEILYGTRTTLDVLNTAQDLYGAQISLVNARASEIRQAYRLLAAVGRLTAQGLALPVALHHPKQHYDEVKFQPIGF